MMHRFLPYILLLCSFFCTGCEFETSDNGALDGYWQLASVEVLHRNSEAASSNTLAVDLHQDMIPMRQFWSFQVNLLQLSDQRFLLPSYLFRFEHRGDSLHIYNPYELDRTSEDRPVTDASMLEPYKLYGLEERFHIEWLKEGTMCLENDSLRFFFNRY